MKKIYMLVASAFVAATSFGQRNIDLELTMATPVAGSTVPQSATQPLDFTINNIADALVVGDTVWLMVVNVTTEVNYTLTGVANSANIFIVSAQTEPIFNAAAGVNSTTMNQGNAMTFNTAASGFSVGDQVAVLVDFSSASGNVGTETAANFANNFKTFTLSAPVVGVDAVEEELAFVAFPNPATSILTIMAKEEVASISVTNLEGKVVATSTTNKVNVAELSNGVYIYEVTTVSGLKAVKKFVKN